MNSASADPCAHLASMIEDFGARATQRELYMSWAYFDETAEDREDEPGSGHKFRYMVVGGCVSNQVKWSRFNQKWKEALDSEGVDVFHAKEFYTYNSPFNWFKNGQRDTGRHSAFRDCLADIILDHADDLIGYVSAARAVKKPVTGAYRDAVDYVLSDTLQNRDEPSSTLKIILAHRKDVSQWSILEKFRNVDWQDKIGGCGIFMPKDVLPLQAADFVLNAMLSMFRMKSNEAFKRLQEGALLRGIGFRTNFKPERLAIVDPQTGEETILDPESILKCQLVTAHPWDGRS